MGQDLVASVKYQRSTSTQNLGNQCTAIPDHMLTLHPDNHLVTAHNSIGSHWRRPNIASHYLCNHTAVDHRFSHKSYIIADSILHWLGCCSFATHSGSCSLEILDCNHSCSKLDSGCSSFAVDLDHYSSTIVISHPMFVARFARARFVANLIWGSLVASFDSRFAKSYAHYIFVRPDSIVAILRIRLRCFQSQPRYL